MDTTNKQGVNFMQFCAMVANFTKTSSRMLESIYQTVLLFHQLEVGDVDGRKDKDRDKEKSSDFTNGDSGLKKKPLSQSFSGLSGVYLFF